MKVNKPIYLQFTLPPSATMPHERIVAIFKSTGEIPYQKHPKNGREMRMCVKVDEQTYKNLLELFYTLPKGTEKKRTAFYRDLVLSNS